MVDLAEQEQLLEPWLGPEVADREPAAAADDRGARPTATRSTPQGLGQRLASEAPGAVFDDHAAWRLPLVATAERLRLLRAGVPRAHRAGARPRVGLAAQAAVAANGAVIRTLRLVGARDGFIARGFTRRLTLRALGRGARSGRRRAIVLLALLPRGERAGLLPGRDRACGLALAGRRWLVPAAAAAIAWRRRRPRDAARPAALELRRCCSIRSLLFDAVLYALMGVMGILCAPLALWSVDGAYAVGPGLLPGGLLAAAGDLRAAGSRCGARCPTGEVLVCAEAPVVPRHPDPVRGAAAARSSS